MPRAHFQYMSNHNSIATIVRISIIITVEASPGQSLGYIDGQLIVLRDYMRFDGQFKAN